MRSKVIELEKPSSVVDLFNTLKTGSFGVEGVEYYDKVKMMYEASLSGVLADIRENIRRIIFLDFDNIAVDLESFGASKTGVDKSIYFNTNYHKLYESLDDASKLEAVLNNPKPWVSVNSNELKEKIAVLQEKVYRMHNGEKNLVPDYSKLEYDICDLAFHYHVNVGLLGIMSMDFLREGDKYVEFMLDLGFGYSESSTLAREWYVRNVVEPILGLWCEFKLNRKCNLTIIKHQSLEATPDTKRLVEFENRVAYSCLLKVLHDKIFRLDVLSSTIVPSEYDDYESLFVYSAICGGIQIGDIHTLVTPFVLSNDLNRFYTSYELDVEDIKGDFFLLPQNCVLEKFPSLKSDFNYFELDKEVVHNITDDWLGFEPRDCTKLLEEPIIKLKLDYKQ